MTFVWHYSLLLSRLTVLFQALDIENNTAQPKTEMCLSSPSHFSSFFTIQLLFKRHFVV